ncbi:hypothetical protein HPB50_003236 [Hyalomma asiaticum]|uniref:Uncharacterized protein n=1 Tax=Hyalomma asiaticum TaxID=266040 RepID=A0ACB7RMH2_HYAAI|nr:hypothetical protein HPB50_003236 [Hyalomma asiaticum]
MATPPRAGLRHLRTEAGILRVLVRTVFNHLPPESGLGRVRKLCRTLWRLLRSRRSPGDPLVALAVEDCELAAAYLMQRLRKGHQVETLLMLLASIARVRSLLQRLVKERRSKQDDVSKLKRLYRRLLKSGCEKPVLLRRTCVRALRSVRAGRSSVDEEARKMRAVCVSAPKGVAGRAFLIAAGWTTLVYWGWLKIARNDMFVPEDERKPLPHELIINYFSGRSSHGSESAEPSGENKRK